MTILTLPEARFRVSGFDLTANTGEHVSPFTRAGQTVGYPGAIWTATFETAARSWAQWAKWRVFFAQLGGREGRFYGFDPMGKVARGVGGGSAVVDGAAQTGLSIAVSSAPLSTTGWLLAGDYVAWDTPGGRRELKLVTADVDTDGSGDATIAFKPAIRVSPADGAALILSEASCIMRLVDDQQGRVRFDPTRVAPVTFQAIEAVYEPAS